MDLCPITHHETFRRRRSTNLSADPHQSPPPPVPDASSPISQLLPLLQTTDPNLTSQFPDYQNAINFFNHLSTMSFQPGSLSFAFQDVLEHAMRENPKFSSKLNELFQLSREQNVPLSINAVSLLIKCFGKARMLEELVMVFDSMDFNIVIDMYFKCGRVDEALKLLKEMLERYSSIPPNANTLNIVLSSILMRKRSESVVADEKICWLVFSFGEHGLFPDSFCRKQIM